MKSYDNRNSNVQSPTDSDDYRAKAAEQEEFGIFNSEPEKLLATAKHADDPRLPIRIYLDEASALKARDKINDRRVKDGTAKSIGFVCIQKRVVVYYPWIRQYRND